MSVLAYRRGRLDRLVGGLFAPSPSSTVVVYRAGAQLQGGQGPVNFFTVLPGHYFPAAGGVSFVAMRYNGSSYSMVAGSMRPVTTSTPTRIDFGGTPLTLLDGDFLVNLGNDAGSGTPLFTASTAAIYPTGYRGGTAISQSRLTPNSQGEYQYFPADRNIWELVLSGSTPSELVVAVPLNQFGEWTANVSDFGAIGDGVTDDTAAFQAAAAYLPNVAGVTTNGGKLVVPRGTWIVSSQITLGNGVVVDGEGGGATTIKAKAGFSGGAVLLFQRPTGAFAAIGVGARNIRIDCNNQSCHGIRLYRPYDAVTLDTVYVDNVDATHNAYRIEPDPTGAVTDVSQTIKLTNCYAIHGVANATAPLYYFDHCQEMSLVNCKGLGSYVANGNGACDIFYFLNCRGVFSLGLSGGITVGRLVRVVSDANGFSQFLSFFGTTVEGCSSNSLATGEALTVEGTVFAGPGPGGNYVQGVQFFGTRIQQAALTPTIVTGGIAFRNASDCYADVRGMKATVDAACEDINLYLNDPADITTDLGRRTHAIADYVTAINRMHKAFVENLTLYGITAGGPALNLAVKGRLDFWELLWSANTGADNGMRLRYYDAAGVAHVSLATEAQGSIMRLYAPTDTENIRMEPSGMSPLLGIKTPAAVAMNPRGIGTWQYNAVTDGTSVTPVVGAGTSKRYTGCVFIPCNVLITGIGYLRSSGLAGAGKVIVSLHDENGVLLANSATVGTGIGPASVVHQVAFTSQYTALGPRLLWLGIIFDTATANTFRTIPAGCQGGNGMIGIGIVNQTFGAVPNFTPANTFAADEVPIASLY